MLALLFTLSAAQCPGGVCPVPYAAPILYQRGPVIQAAQPVTIYYPQYPPVLRLQPFQQTPAVYYYQPVPGGPLLQYWPPLTR
jgi:hypothetical protein